MLSRSGVLQGCAPRRIFISPAVGPTFGLTQKWAKSQGCDSLPDATSNIKATL